MISRIALIRIEGKDWSLSVPISWHAAWNAGLRSRIDVKFGALEATAQLRVLASSEPNVIVGEPLAKELRLHSGMRLQIKYFVDEHKAAFGPIMGIFTVRRSVFSRESLGPYGSRSQYYAPLIRRAQRRGMLVYLFSPQDIDWESNTVLGYSHDNGVWGFERYPLPDVVYDRVPSRTDERRPEVINAKERLCSRCHYFNPAYLNKWEVYNLLVTRPEVRSFLPETRIMRGSADLIQFLSRHTGVYLKPTMSSVGKGIMKVVQTGNGYTLHRRKADGGSVRLFYPNAAKLMATVDGLCRGQTYMVQQAIDLATFDGHVFDIRALAQKDGQGDWSVTGMAARVAALGGIVTHVPNGGTRQPLRRVIPADSFPAIRQRLYEAARIIPAVLEEEMGKLFGELSLDLALDRYGKVWLIEANAKPFSFDEPAIRGVARENLLEFACYLHHNF